MAPARAADPARADLALLRDVAAELADVLVVDLVDLALAEETGFASPAGCRRQTLPASLFSLLCHGIPLDQNGMSSSAPALPKSASDPPAPAGTNSLPPPPPPASPESPLPPRNCTESATTSTAWRF